MKSIRPAFLLGIVAVCCAPTSSLAERLGYSPQITGLDLGKGIAGIDYGNPRDACVLAAKKPVPKSASSMNVSIVYNASQLAQSLHIDSKAQASFMSIASAAGHFNLDEEFHDSNRAFDVVIEAWQETGNDTFEISPDWLPKYKAKIAAGRYDEVRRDCGDRYVSTVYNAARLFALVRVEMSAQDFHLHVSTGGEAKFNIDIVDASAQLGVETDIKTAHQHGAISVVAISEGLGGFQDLSNIIAIANADGLADIETKTQAALSNAHVKGQAVAYELISYPGLPARSLADDTIDYHLSEIRTRYLQTRGTLNNVDCLLNNCDGRATLLKPPDLVTLKAYRSRLLNSADDLSVRFQKCAAAYSLNDSSCTAAMPNMPPVPAINVLYWNLPPVWGGLLVVLDHGRVLSSAEGTTILSQAVHSPNLLEAARTIYPDATSLDVLGRIQSPYFSVMSILPLELGDKLPIPRVSVGAAFGKNTLPVDPAWNLSSESSKYAFYMPLLHADGRNSCSTKAAKDVALNSNLLGFDGSCVSVKAKQLFNAVKTAAEAAAHAGCFSSLPTFSHPDELKASMSNLFGLTAPSVVGSFYIAYAHQPSGKCRVDSQLNIENPFHSYLLGLYFESEEIKQ